MNATMERASGYARIDELAAGELFGRYMSAFPDRSRDAGRMLRVAVQTGQVDRYQALLELAIRDRKPVADAQWHGLCAAVSWPRPLPEWDRAPIEQWRLDMNPDATPDWPKAYIWERGFGPNSPLALAHKDLPRWLRRGAAPLTVGAHRRGKVGARDLLKALAIAICL